MGFFESMPRGVTSESHFNSTGFNEGDCADAIRTNDVNKRKNRVRPRKVTVIFVAG